MKVTVPADFVGGINLYPINNEQLTINKEQLTINNE